MKTRCHKAASLEISSDRWDKDASFIGTWRGGFVGGGAHLRWTETRRRRRALTAKTSAEAGKVAVTRHHSSLELGGGLTMIDLASGGD